MLSRMLKAQCINLDLKVEPPFDGDGNPLTLEKGLWIIKEQVIQQLVNLHNRSGNVQNKNKLFQDLLNRERKATTGIGNGIAIPHVRTIQVKDISFCFARSVDGIDFDTVDGESCKLFFSLVGPSYDDQLYLKVFKKLALMLQYDTVKKALLNAESPNDIVRIINDNEQ